MLTLSLKKKISNITKGPRFKDFQFILVSKCYTKKFIFFLIQNVEQNTKLQKQHFVNYLPPCGMKFM